MKKQARWLAGAVSLLLCLLLATPLAVAASAGEPDPFENLAYPLANAVHSVDVDVTLHADGSATVLEHWRVRQLEGSEFYTSKTGMLDGVAISGFTVYDAEGTFEDSAEWRSSWNQERKARKSHLQPTMDGYELILGLGEYGEHSFTMQYTMHNLVQEVPDGSVLLQSFIPSGLEPPAQSYSIRLRLEGTPLTDSIASVKTFGFVGEASLVDGEIVVESLARQKAWEEIGLVVSLDKTLFTGGLYQNGDYFVGNMMDVAKSRLAAPTRTAVLAIDVYVDLHEDGSATITEQWDMSFADGTEGYIAKHNLDKMTITNLRVWDETGRLFEDVGKWDTSLSRAAKAYKSGLVETKGGYELCWGFGETGYHSYTVQYDMTNLVKGYKGGDAITHIFVPQNLSSSVPSVSVTLHYEGHSLSYPDTRMWVFNCTADYGFANGDMWVQTTKSLTSSQQVNIRVSFKPGQFAPVDTRSKSIEKLEAEGLKGSSYSTSFLAKLRADPLMFAIMGLTLLLFVWMIIKSIVSRARYRRLMRGYKKADYCRQLPFGGDIAATFVRLSELREVNNDSILIGAYTLRWLCAGQIELVREPGRFGREQDSVRMPAPFIPMEPVEFRLYNYMRQAAGPDEILQPSELQKWCKKNGRTIHDWFQNYHKKGRSALVSQGVYLKCLRRSFPNDKNLTDRGRELTSQMFGFKNFLQDFTILSEREAIEVHLWNEYLVYAQLFGIADRVAAQFQRLYPEYMNRSDGSTHNFSTTDLYSAALLGSSYANAAQRGGITGSDRSYSDYSSSGGGGSSSSGGGGGSSGGSSGGGGGGR